jgi:hypothetical protein
MPFEIHEEPTQIPMLGQLGKGYRGMHPSNGRRKILEEQSIWIRAQGHGPLHRILQLTHIARPTVGFQGLKGSRFHLFDGLGQFPGELADEVRHEYRNILRVILQRM